MVSLEDLHLNDKRSKVQLRTENSISKQEPPSKGMEPLPRPSCFLSPFLNESRFSRSASCPSIDRQQSETFSVGLSPVSISRFASHISEQNSSCCCHRETDSWRDSSLNVDVESISEDERRSTSASASNSKITKESSNLNPKQLESAVRFQSMHTRRLQTRDDIAVVNQCSNKCGLRKATISKLGILNIGDLPPSMAEKVMCESVLERREHRRARAKCLEWLDSLDSDDTEVNGSG